MGLFEKKVKLFQSKDRKEVQRREELLKANGIRAHSWETEAFPALGGAHMVAADWAGKKPEMKRDERTIWNLEVPEKDQFRAMKILMEADGAQM